MCYGSRGILCVDLFEYGADILMAGVEMTFGIGFLKLWALGSIIYDRYY